jgi:hypothetical protein
MIIRLLLLDFRALLQYRLPELIRHHNTSARRTTVTQFHSSAVANRAPSADAANLSQATLGWVSLNLRAEAANRSRLLRSRSRAARRSWRTEITGSDFYFMTRGREIFPPLSLLVHGRFNLELAVEIVLGRIDGDVPADFTVEKIVPVGPLACPERSRRVPDVPSLTAVGCGKCERDDRDLAGRNFDVFELGEIERVAAELNPHFLAAQRAMKGNCSSSMLSGVRICSTRIPQLKLSEGQT